jgi:hypothetical protein
MQSGNSKKIQDILCLLPIHGNNGLFDNFESRLAATYSFANSTSKFAYDISPKRITECQGLPFILHYVIMHALLFVIETIQANQLSRYPDHVSNHNIFICNAA